MDKRCLIPPQLRTRMFAACVQQFSLSIIRHIGITKISNKSIRQSVQGVRSLHAHGQSYIKLNSISNALLTRLLHFPKCSHYSLFNYWFYMLSVSQHICSPHACTNLFQNSFFPCSISSWNSLLAEITSTSSILSFNYYCSIIPKIILLLWVHCFVLVFSHYSVYPVHSCINIS